MSNLHQLLLLAGRTCTRVARKDLSARDRVNLRLLERQGFKFAGDAARIRDSFLVTGASPWGEAAVYDSGVGGDWAAVTVGDDYYEIATLLGKGVSPAERVREFWTTRRATEELSSLGEDLPKDQQARGLEFLRDVFEHGRAETDERDFEEFAKSYYQHRYGVDIDG